MEPDQLLRLGILTDPPVIKTLTEQRVWNFIPLLLTTAYKYDRLILGLHRRNVDTLTSKLT